MVLLKITLSITGWLLTYVYAIAPIAIGVANCTQGSDDPWLASLIFYIPALVLGLLFASFGKQWAKWLRMFSLPHLATIIFGTLTVLPFLIGSTFLGKHVCQVQTGNFEELVAPWWHTLWAPIHLICILSILIFSVWFLKRSKNHNENHIASAT